MESPFLFSISFRIVGEEMSGILKKWYPCFIAVPYQGTQFVFPLAYSYLYVTAFREVRLHLNKKRNFFFVLSSICTNFMSLRAMKVLMLGKTQNKFWFFARLFVPLHPERFIAINKVYV